MPAREAYKNTCTRTQHTRPAHAHAPPRTHAPLQLLGVEAGATFDDIMNAKNQALGRAGGDMEQQVQVDAAYGAQRLRVL